jgi:hypothetical protein
LEERCEAATRETTAAALLAALSHQVVRKFWGRPDAVIVSDCGAVANQDRWK